MYIYIYTYTIKGLEEAIHDMLSPEVNEFTISQLISCA